MLTFHPTVALACAVTLASSAVAQTVSGEFSPNPVAPGATVTFTATDAIGAGLNLPSPCTWYIVHRGTQNGPIVDLGHACGAVIVPIPANGSFSLTWDQTDANGRTVPPDLYWFEIFVYDPNFNPSRDWFCLSIQAPNVPALTKTGPVRVNQVTPLNVTAPTLPSALFAAALSLSSNQPLTAFHPRFCLSVPIFDAGLVTPVGVLDPLGSGSVALALPNVPSIAYLGLHAQAVVVTPTGLLEFTNDLSISIRP